MLCEMPGAGHRALARGMGMACAREAGEVGRRKEGGKDGGKLGRRAVMCCKDARLQCRMCPQGGGRWVGTPERAAQGLDQSARRHVALELGIMTTWWLFDCVCPETSAGRSSGSGAAQATGVPPARPSASGAGPGTPPAGPGGQPTAAPPAGSVAVAVAVAVPGPPVQPDDSAVVLLLYHLTHGCRLFQDYCLSRTDPETVLLPLLRSLYACPERAANQMYMLQVRPGVARGGGGGWRGRGVCGEERSGRLVCGAVSLLVERGRGCTCWE